MIKIKLREIVEKKGYKDVSYRKLAEQVGVSHLPIYKMMNGETYNPSLEMLDKLCTFFKCKPGDLLVHVRG